MFKNWNSIILNVALVCLANAYEIKEPCNCGAITQYEPVCGTDNKTYSNSGVLECENKCNGTTVEVNYKGECKQVKPCNCIIPLNYQPVCGTNGKTYGNKQALDCENKCNCTNIKVAYQGICNENPTKPPCVCPILLIYLPVCGSDGKTYGNIQALNCEKKCNNVDVKEAYAGECKPKPCDCIVPAIFDPVCGSDGKTYSSSYVLRCANKCNGSHIALAYKGACKPKTEKPCDCAAIALYKPVCGTDGKTYGNSGVLGCANKCDKTNIGVAHEGECGKPYQS